MTSTPTPRFGALIQSARKKAGLSQQALADQLGVVRNTIFFWESDRRRPDHEIIPRLCEILSLTPNELYGIYEEEEGIRENRAETPDEKQILSLYRSLHKANQESVPPILTSLLRAQEAAETEYFQRSFSLFTLGATKAAAGIGCDYSDEENSYCFLRRNKRNQKADMIVKVTGESMLPLYEDGSSVYVETSCPGNPGDDVVVNTTDGLIIKRLTEERQLVSLNPAYPYKPSSDDEAYRIVGKVLGVVSPYDYPSPEDITLLEELYSQDIQALKATRSR